MSQNYFSKLRRIELFISVCKMTCLTRLVILLLVIAYIGASNDESNHVDVDEKVSLGTKSKHEICERVSSIRASENILN